MGVLGVVFEPEPELGRVLGLVINLTSLGTFDFANDPIAKSGMQAYYDVMRGTEHWEDEKREKAIMKTVRQRTKDRRYMFQMRVFTPNPDEL